MNTLLTALCLYSTFAFATCKKELTYHPVEEDQSGVTFKEEVSTGLIDALETVRKRDDRFNAKDWPFTLHWILEVPEAIEMIAIEFAKGPNEREYRDIWAFQDAYVARMLKGPLDPNFLRHNHDRGWNKFKELILHEMAYYIQVRDQLLLEQMDFKISGLDKLPEIQRVQYALWLRRKQGRLPGGKRVEKNDPVRITHSQLQSIGISKTGYAPQLSQERKKYLKDFYVAFGKRMVEENSANSKNFGALLVLEENAGPYWHFMRIIDLFGSFQKYLQAVGLEVDPHVNDFYFECIVQAGVEYIKVRGLENEFKRFQVRNANNPFYVDLFTDTIRLAWNSQISKRVFISKLNQEILSRLGQ